MQEYIGYHGTDNNSAQIIIDTQHFNASRRLDAWLGKGIYFFQYFDDAQWWCKSNRRLKEGQYQVLQVRIVADSVIDLVGSRTDIENFYQYCEVVKRKCGYLPDGRLRDNYMSLAVKILLQKAANKIDMIIGGFRQNRKVWYADSDEEARQFPLVPVQVQYCVLNHGCIRDMKIYGDGEEGKDDG